MTRVDILDTHGAWGALTEHVEQFLSVGHGTRLRLGRSMCVGKTKPQARVRDPSRAVDVKDRHDMGIGPGYWSRLCGGLWVRVAREPGHDLDDSEIESPMVWMGWCLACASDKSKERSLT